MFIHKRSLQGQPLLAFLSPEPMMTIFYSSDKTTNLTESACDRGTIWRLSHTNRKGKSAADTGVPG